MFNRARKIFSFFAALFHSPARRNSAVLVLLAVVTLATYCRVARFEFITYDDQDYVSGNTHVHAGITRAGLAWAFFTLHPARTYWHPLAWVSHMVDCQLFGPRAGGHHLMSVLLHTANVLLLFVLLQRLTGAFWRSAMVAALFALHPLQVDSVAWVTERKNLLSTLFWLLALLAYVRYAAAPDWRRYGLVMLCFALALLSKVVIVTLPCVLLLLDVWPLKRLKAEARNQKSERRPETETRKKQAATRPVRPSGFGLLSAFGFRPSGFSLRTCAWLFVEKLPLFALAAGAIVLLFGSQRQIVANISAELPLSCRIGNALVSYARYLGKTLWPEHLSIFYVHPGQWPAAAVWASALLLVLLSGLVLWRARRQPALLLGWLWFLGVLVPMIGLIQSGEQAMADRFAYVPLIGLFLALVWAAADLAAGWKHRGPVLSAAALLVLSACIALTSRQLSYWKNSRTLFEHIVSFDPDNYVAQNNLGTALSIQYRYDDAFPHFQAALRVRPRMAEAYCNWGIALKEHGKDLPAAKAKLLAALELDPSIEPAYCNLAAIAQTEDKWEEAIGYTRQVLSVSPDFPEAHNDLGLALQHQGHLEEAAAEFITACAQDPAYAAPRYNLGTLRHKQARHVDAIAEFRAALRLNPDWPEALNNLAWALATQTNPALRDGPEAIRLAARAAQLTGQTNFNVLGTLAAAYAEAGQFTNAIATALQAEALARATGDTNLLAAKSARVALLRTGQPVREP